RRGTFAVLLGCFVPRWPELQGQLRRTAELFPWRAPDRPSAPARSMRQKSRCKIFLVELPVSRGTFASSADAPRGRRDPRHDETGALQFF
ncbi:hypothetical protein RB213_009449, partial [Colletotrichum asianum]